MCLCTVAIHFFPFYALGCCILYLPFFLVRFALSIHLGIFATAAFGPWRLLAYCCG